MSDALVWTIYVKTTSFITVKPRIMADGSYSGFESIHTNQIWMYEDATILSDIELKELKEMSALP